MPVRFRWEKNFKDTEIGRIPKDWEVRRIGDIVNRIIKGKVPKKPRNDNNTVEKLPYLSVEYIRGETIQTKLFPASWGVPVNEEDILIIWDGANAGEVLKGKKGLLSSTVAKLETNEEVNKSFFFNYLKLNEDSLKSLRSGTDNRHVDKQALLDYLVPLPPLPEQSRIATVLSWFDELIEVKKKQNKILEKTAMAIFKSWFIDFEPFKDEEFVYSEELGREIPKGWEVKPIGKIVDIQKGISYKGSEKFNEPVNGSYVFITLDNFIRGGGFKTEYSWIKSERIKEYQFVKEGDLIIALTDMTQNARVVGAPAIVVLPDGYNKGVISLDCAKLILKNVNLKYFLYLILKYTQEENATFANGVSVLHLNTNLFMQNKCILLPPSPILQKFHSLVQPLFEKIINNQKEIMILKKVRDTLLPLLVFGKLRVEGV